MQTFTRIVRRGLFPAALLLPCWLLIGWLLFGTGIWEFLGLLLLSAGLAVALLALAAAIAFRPSNRRTGTVTPTEAGLCLAIAAGLVWLGCWTSFSGIGGAVALLGWLAAFWYEVTRWTHEAGRAHPQREKRIVDIGEITVTEEDAPQDDNR